MANFKTPRIRDEAYLDLVRKMSCCIQMDGKFCNGGPIDAHHLTCTGDGIMGDKAPDNRVLPVCRFHHQTLHFIGEITFWNQWEIDSVEEAKRLWESYRNINNRV